MPVPHAADPYRASGLVLWPHDFTCCDAAVYLQWKYKQTCPTMPLRCRKPRKCRPRSRAITRPLASLRSACQPRGMATGLCADRRDCGGRHRLGAYAALGPGRFRTGRCRRLEVSIIPGVGGQGRLSCRFVMSPVGCPADRWSPNPTVTNTALAALQSDRGDVFCRQTGVRDASAVLGPEQVEPPFVRQSFLFFAR
jgi:hypothetical protein